MKGDKKKLTKCGNERKEYWEKVNALKEGGRSVCMCGHLGDGPNSQHHDHFNFGHGKCKVEGCDCEQFTWTRWKPEILALTEK